MLASPVFSWLGNIAYALYLWHWPLLILATAIGRYESPPAFIGFMVIATSLVLAHVTHLVIEEPLRQHSPRPTALDRPVAKARNILRTPAGTARALGGVLVAALAIVTLSVKPYWDNDCLLYTSDAADDTASV